MKTAKKIVARTSKKVDNRLRPSLPKAAVTQMNSLKKLGMSISLIVKNLQKRWKNINYYDVWKQLGNPGSHKIQAI